MNKLGVIFTWVLAVMAALAVTPSAQAVPAFARQMGVPCSTCHFQHFPELNSFGRAFKESGYTMIGSEDKIEGNGMLSLPVVLNGAFVGYLADQKTNGPKLGETSISKSTNQNQLQIPQQVSLFLAGRAGEHIGFESEINLTGTGPGTQQESAGNSNTGLIRVKVPIVYDMGNVHTGVVPFSTVLGVADSFEVLNTGAVAVHAFNQTTAGSVGLGGMNVVSAQQYIGTATPASGVAFIASNDHFFANVAIWSANQGSGNASPGSNYFRAAWTTDLIPGFDSAIGVQSWSGSSGSDPDVGGGLTAGGATAGMYETKATAVDAQMLGEVHGMPLTLVASYASAPASSATGNENLFNAGRADIKSFNIGAELGVIPNKATVQLGLRRASSGQYVPGTTAGNASDNAILVGATYALAYNARFELTYVKASGDLYNGAAGSQTDATSNGNAGTYGDSAVTVDLAFGF